MGLQSLISLYAAMTTVCWLVLQHVCCVHPGREVHRLVASAVLDLQEQLLQRLGAGEHVAVTVLLQETPACRVQHMPDGLGSQVCYLPDFLHALMSMLVWISGRAAGTTSTCCADLLLGTHSACGVEDASK